MKIRIVHCIETISSGGVDQIRLTLAEGLDREKYELKIICTGAYGPLVKLFKDEGVEIIEVGHFKHPFQWSKHKKVIQFLHHYKPHLIHGAVFEGMTMAAISGLLGRVPIIILEETSDPKNRSEKAIWLQRQLALTADKVIGIAPSIVKYLVERARIPNRKVILLNNGVKAPKTVKKEIIASIKDRLGIKKKNIVIGSVGRLNNEVKRFTDILEAFHLLQQPQIKFLLVGDGKDRHSIKMLAKHLGLENQLIDVGYQSDPTPYYSVMDIFCIVSDNEGFGLVAAEAMYHRLPVIATAVGGLKDIVVNGETGFLVPSHSPDIIAEKLQLLIDHPELRRSMGAKGLARAEKEYSAKVYVEKVHQLYQELLREKVNRI